MSNLFQAFREDDPFVILADQVREHIKENFDKDILGITSLTARCSVGTLVVYEGIYFDTESKPTNFTLYYDHMVKGN